MGAFVIIQDNGFASPYRLFPPLRVLCVLCG